MPLIDSDRWRRAKELFAAALERESSQRAAFLHLACRDDEALRCEIQSLLVAHDEAGGFIETPVESDTGFGSDAPAPALEGRRIGHYVLVRRLGVGGMGSVYLAERAEAFRQQVAIKLIRPGLDTEEILRRFTNERQTLADLDHPNIAKLLDGGTTEDGLPYLVMEYVEGLPINEYCDAQQLSVRQRIELFRTVCVAVQAAHRNLVVHRDIKSSNILVTTNGEPKLLDFGIAKILPRDGDPGAEFTRTIERMMTPQYASPEQLRGGAISTLSDIYSLGVLLYRLVTGVHPYQIDGLSPGELERIICEQEPIRPSMAVTRATGQLAVSSCSLPALEHSPRLKRELSGDLDRIVLMALRKEAAERYQSAEALGEDLDRWLRGEPVRARPVGAAGRLWRWSRRNRALASALVAVAFCFFAGFVSVSFLWWRATAYAHQLDQERAAARTHADSAERNLLQVVRAVREFADFRNIQSQESERGTAFRRMLQHFQPVLDHPPDDPRLKEEIAETCFVVARIGVEVLKLDDIAPVVDTGARLYQELAAQSPEGTRFLAEAGRCLFLKGSMYSNRLDYDAAMIAYDQSREMFRAAGRADPNYPGATRNLVAVSGNIAIIHSKLGDTPRALAAFHDIVETFDQIRRQRKLDEGDMSQLAETYTEIARIKPPHERADYLAKTTAIRRELAAEFPTKLRHQHHLARSYVHSGTTARELGQLPEAIDYLQRAVTIMQQTVDESVLIQVRRFDLADAQLQLGQLLADTLDYTAAIEALQHAHDAFQLLADGQNGSSPATAGLIQTLADLARVHEAQGNLAAAAELATRRRELEHPTAE